MLDQRSGTTDLRNGLVRREMLLPLAVLCVQLVATGFFMFDAARERIGQPDGFSSPGFVMECFVALALLSGIITSYRYMARLKRELRWQENALERAKGALGEHVVARFRNWGLSPVESEVAMFALKGFGVSEIAGLRNSAQGTIRSQLSQIYKKAGVSGHAELIASFIDDLLEVHEARRFGKV